MSLIKKAYYLCKPLIPRSIQIGMRRNLVAFQRKQHKDVWPIDEEAGEKPEGFYGWPHKKKFALVLTHDVETAIGHENCKNLCNLEKGLGFKSSFNFVPEKYDVSSKLRMYLEVMGDEVGVHGLNHDGKLFSNKKIFMKRASKINKYLKVWDSVGFRSPAMYHNLDWIGHLDIIYDLSIFDTDPFEPQSDGVKTIFPFIVKHKDSKKSYVEMPYTLVQDFTLFKLMKEKTIDIWKKKLDWIAEKGGMALINVHPDYMNFSDKKNKLEQYPAKFYEYFLNYVSSQYKNEYWHGLPKEIAEFWKNSGIKTKNDLVFPIKQ